MDPDGTIRLRLRATGGHAMVGDAELAYPPDHPGYQAILKHLGGIQAGQEVPVPPWERHLPIRGA